MLELLDAALKLCADRHAVSAAVERAVIEEAKNQGIDLRTLDGKASDLAQYGGAVIYYP